MKLYKYIGIEKFERDLDNITKSQLFYSDSSFFNDPFDCAPTVVSMSLQEKRDFLAKLIADANPLVPASSVAHIRDALAGDDDEVERLVDVVNCPEYAEKVRARFGILCLSSEPDSLLLWSHYASSHEGFALIFDIIKPLRQHVLGSAQPAGYAEYNLLASSVEYSKVRPRTFSASSELYEPFFTKSECWSYENEYRVASDLGSGLKRFDSELLKGVIFGAKISGSHRDALKERVAENNADRRDKINLYQSNLNKEEFRLDILEI